MRQGSRVLERVTSHSTLVWLYARIPLLRIEKLFYYLTFITGFIWAALFPIDLGLFTIFPYRIFLVLLWGLFAARTLIQGKVVLPSGHVRLYMAFFGIWMAYAMISLGWAASKGDAIRSLIFLLMGISLIFFTTYYCRDNRTLSNLYWIWFGAFCILIFIGFWEHLTGQHLPVSGYYEEKILSLADYVKMQVLHRPTGVFNNPNDYATFLALSIPFGLGVLRYARRRLARLIGLGTAFAAFYLIVVTGSRANMLAVLLELAFLMLLLTNLRQKVKVAVATMVCLAMALLLLPGPVQEFASEVSGELSTIATQAQLGIESVAIRTNLALNGLVFLYSTAGFGVGAGNAEYWMANFARYDTAGILNQRNWWLEIMINYGIFVFVGYVAVYIGIIRGLWRFWRKTADRRERVIAESLFLALIGFSVASISSSSIMAFNPQWMLFASAIAFLNHKRRGKRG